MTIYFAYGSNMDRSAMKRRYPGAHAIGQPCSTISFLRRRRWLAQLHQAGDIARRAVATDAAILLRSTLMNCCIRASTMRYPRALRPATDAMIYLCGARAR
jgi:hypothetical protein